MGTTHTPAGGRACTPYRKSALRLLFSAGLLAFGLLLLAACGTTTTGSEIVNLVVTPVPSPTPSPQAPPTVPPVTYRVKEGDTLSGIAAMFGVTVDDIVHSNNIADPNSLSVGQVLTIPGHTASAASPTATPTTTPTPAGPPTPALPPPDVTPPLGPTISP